MTPLVTNIQPKFASPAGGDSITITGSGFGTSTSDASVAIDGVACAVQSVTDSEIVCITGARASMPAKSSFSVRIAGNTASLTCDSFVYAYRWSDPLTWGGDLPPVDGDTVYVPKGMILLVDQSTPNLYTIIVEGSIIFSDESEMIIETHFLIV